MKRRSILKSILLGLFTPKVQSNAARVNYESVTPLKITEDEAYDNLILKWSKNNGVPTDPPISIQGWDVSKVTDFTGMFDECKTIGKPSDGGEIRNSMREDMLAGKLHPNDSGRLTQGEMDDEEEWFAGDMRHTEVEK